MMITWVSVFVTGSVAVSIFTVCCSFDFRFPASCAFLRRRWIESITSFCCSRNASPRLWVQSSFSSIVVSTVGNGTSDFTLSSQLCAASALSSAAPFSFAISGFFAQRAASTISSG